MKEAVVKLGRSSVAHRGKGIAEWHMGRSSKKCSKRGG